MRRYCVGATRSWQEDWSIADAAPLPPFSFLVFTFHSYPILLAPSVLIRSYPWSNNSSHPLHLLNKLPRILRMSGPKLIQPSIQPLSRIRHRPYLNPETLRDLLPFLESSADALEQIPQLRLRSQKRAELPHEPPDYQP